MHVSRKKVIRVQFDANFFYNRALQSMDRFHYAKALKYFKRVLEYEPSNITNHWNVAGILSELGNYDESNRILYRTLETFEEGQTESHFYLANNFANMDLWEQAEEEIVRYLEQDPNGFYLQEAEEMIDFMTMEFNRTPKLATVKSRAQYFEHDQARELLEQGKLPEAIEQLKKIVAEYPDFTAARNNLGLAYFYSGKQEQSLQAIIEVLNVEAGNIHAICNMALVFHHLGAVEQLQPVREQLMKLIPFTDEHLFKLATTLGFLDEHELAYRHFVRLRRHTYPGVEVEPNLLHFIGVAAYNCGHYDEAGHMWRQVLKLDKDAVLAEHYLQHLDEWKKKYNSQVPLEKLHYHYHLPQNKE